MSRAEYLANIARGALGVPPAGNTKHTPGPWEASEYYITAGKDKMGAPVCIAVSPSGIHGNEFREADARLMAESPRLLAACREALAYLEGEPVERYAVEGELRAAIAATEGR